MIDEVARRQAKKAASGAREALSDVRVLHRKIVALEAVVDSLCRDLGS